VRTKGTPHKKKTPQGVANKEVMIFNHYMEWKWKGPIRSKSNLDEWILFPPYEMANLRICN
jgi:hypothetical protein